jgi:hypothetical protein
VGRWPPTTAVPADLLPPAQRRAIPEAVSGEGHRRAHGSAWPGRMKFAGTLRDPISKGGTSSRHRGRQATVRDGGLAVLLGSIVVVRHSRRDAEALGC